MHHPKNWDFVYFGSDKNRKGYLLPSLSVLQLDAGINNVREMGKGNADPNLAIVKMKDNGFTILDPTKEDYLRVYPAIKGKHHADKWTTFEVIGDTVIKEFDYDKFDLWRKSLMSEGKIKLPHRHFIGLLLKDYRRQIDKYIKGQHIPQNEHKLKIISKEESDIKTFMKKLIKEGAAYYE